MYTYIYFDAYDILYISTFLTIHQDENKHWVAGIGHAVKLKIAIFYGAGGAKIHTGLSSIQDRAENVKDEKITLPSKFSFVVIRHFQGSVLFSLGLSRKIGLCLGLLHRNKKGGAHLHFNWNEACTQRPTVLLLLFSLYWLENFVLNLCGTFDGTCGYMSISPYSALQRWKSWTYGNRKVHGI